MIQNFPVEQIDFVTSTKGALTQESVLVGEKHISSLCQG